MDSFVQNRSITLQVGYKILIKTKESGGKQILSIFMKWQPDNLAGSIAAFVTLNFNE